MLKLEKLAKKESRYVELEGQLSDPAIIADQGQYQKLAKEFSDLTPVIETYRAYRSRTDQIQELQTVLKDNQDPEFAELARNELDVLEAKKDELADQLEQLTHPIHTEKNRDVIIEIRAGTGGQEASLFAADLYRMYVKYSESQGWRCESINHHESETGGFKEVIFSVSGNGASRRLKWESGVHRVQRVPATEASGRIHTSAATVAVLFEPEELEIEIDPKDLKIDVFRSSGPGGQSVNTTDSAIRITHISTGIVVICQDERSQLKNKHKAMRVLRARLLDKMRQESLDKETQERKAMVGSGDRSEKIRTYNYPDRRVTDHRIGFTTYRLPEVMNGDLNEITAALTRAELESIEEDAP